MEVKQSVITKPRWEAECILMANNFPQFVAFSCDGLIGFQGRLRGKRSGRIYEVWIQAHKHGYPQQEPAVYMDPRPEPHHWIGDGRLCVVRTWIPGLSTFANTLLVAAKYVADFDR